MAPLDDAGNHLALGRGTEIAYDTVRVDVRPLTSDRATDVDIDRIRRLVESGRLVERIARDVDLV